MKNANLISKSLSNNSNNFEIYKKKESRKIFPIEKNEIEEIKEDKSFEKISDEEKEDKLKDLF